MTGLLRATDYRKGNVMKSNYRAFVSACGATVLAALFVPAASACGGSVNGPFVFPPLSVDPESPMQGATAENLQRDARASASGRAASIVGMWKITELSAGNTNHNPPIPDGAQLDFGYAQWHSDGTEFYNSGGYAPATQNYCMGVWVQTGAYTYQVNHFAITYDMNGTYTGTLNILETITLSPGGTKYSGTLTINAFDTNGTQVNHVTGQVIGERITVDTTP